MSTTTPAATSSSSAGAPMALLGVQPGISVIDPATVLTRLWYFDGKFLRAEGFRLDQEYVRALVALSNQAVGTGVVQGFDVRLGTGDELLVEGGLGLAPSGRVVHLPSDVGLSIAQLIARSSGEIDPGRAPRPGVADFGLCPADEPASPDVVAGVRPLYLLTVAATEALCGEEERFGQLCEDACAAETDRSVAVEGVRFRVRPLQLTLPVSTAIPFTGTHLRSRLASAYFRRERDAVPAMISAAGLRAPVWCAGADGIGGEEIPLAVFDRDGTVTRVLDQWTARRELVEATPQRYWLWRMAMRPLDVFLAEVLQFQCQLLGLGADGGAPDDAGGCVEERRVLEVVGKVLGDLGAPAGSSDVSDRLVTSVNLPDALAARFFELRGLVRGVLAGATSATGGSTLIGGGIIELPAAGYLPIDRQAELVAQVKALMGPGVDLRFCAVRADFVAEAFFEAQHMQRISLTQGLDDPARLEQVDVLVPGGTLTTAPSRVGEFEGAIRALPRTSLAETGSVLTAATVAREHDTAGWSWTLASFAEAPQQLAVSKLGAFVADRLLRRRAKRVFAEPVHVEPDQAQDRVLADTAFWLRAIREGAAARERFERAATIGTPEPVTPDLAVAADVRRPVVGWVDLETGEDLRRVGLDQTTTFRGRGIVYTRARREPAFADVDVRGSLVITAIQTGASPGMVTITTRVTGFATVVVASGGDPPRDQSQAIRDRELVWRFGAAKTGARLLSIEVVGEDAPLILSFEDAGTPRIITGDLAAIRRGRPRIDTVDWREILDERAAGTTVRLGDGELREVPGCLDVGRQGRDLGDAVIDVIAGELASQGRDLDFGGQARARLFGEGQSATSTITPAADWVLFHRRRTKVCGEPDVERPVAVRRFRWYHATTDDIDVLGPLTRLAGRWDATSADVAGRVWDRLDDVGWQLVTTLEFPERSADLQTSPVVVRTAWSAGSRGTDVILGVVATEGVGDGGTVNLGRLLAATGTVSDLVDTSRMRTKAFTAVPPDFRATGIDGVIVTVAIDRGEVETAIALALAVAPQAWTLITDLVEQLERVTVGDLDGILREFETPEPIELRYTEDEITNRGEVLAWGQNRRLEPVALVLDEQVAADQGKLDRWSTSRSIELGDVLGIGAISVSAPNDRPWDLGDHEALFCFVDRSMG